MTGYLTHVRREETSLTICLDERESERKFTSRERTKERVKESEKTHEDYLSTSRYSLLLALQ